ncbi:MAG: hypothetical protein ACI9IT_002464 [Glaciecola sp.]|jgi:hypothetical protein
MRLKLTVVKIKIPTERLLATAKLISGRSPLLNMLNRFIVNAFY